MIHREESGIGLQGLVVRGPVLAIDIAPVTSSVPPDAREREIQAQLCRPSFADTGVPDIHYILFSDLCAHCDGLCKFGTDHTALTKIARRRPG